MKEHGENYLLLFQAVQAIARKGEPHANANMEFTAKFFQQQVHQAEQEKAAK